MLTLTPEKVNFEISTTDILVKYTERSVTSLEVDVLDLENYINRKTYKSICFLFSTVAELKCCSLNFHEAFYDEYEISDLKEGGDELEFWKENGYHPDSGLYQIDKSEWLKESKSKYDPQGNLALKHYLIIGNDSYVELLAQSYSLSNLSRLS